MDDILASFASNGPLLPRLILTGALVSPIVAISLQRDTVDIGGNQGVLSIGELPAGLAMEDLTWVPLRGYTTAEGGLPAPRTFPNEVHLSARIFPTLMNVESDLPHYLGKSPLITYILMGGSCHGHPLAASKRHSACPA